MADGEHKGTVLIIGASSGIGAVYADRSAQRGQDLILIARNGDRLRALATQLSNDMGCAVETIAADLINPIDLAQVETALRTDASITMLVNNAGVAATGLLLASPLDAALPGFVARGTGTIINIASVVALVPERLNGVYGASKAFVLALSRSLHHELTDKSVRIQAVLPGAQPPTSGTPQFLGWRTCLPTSSCPSTTWSTRRSPSPTKANSSPFRLCPKTPTGLHMRPPVWSLRPTVAQPAGSAKWRCHPQGGLRQRRPSFGFPSRTQSAFGRPHRTLPS